jgi:hypothetical protein
MTAPHPVAERLTHGLWPELPLAEWQDTLATLHRWLQIIGKTRLTLAPPVNHWWHVTLYLTPRGLTTSAMPHGTRSIDVELDFIDHRLVIRTSDGSSRTMSVAPRSVAELYHEYLAHLDSLGTPVEIRPIPNELEDELPFPDDREHRSYDPEYATRCWRILSQANRVLQEFRGRFIGKCSPVHFFWGAFDLACTRFSGRSAPLHPGGVPHLPDWAVREAYSHECISAGWWPGGTGFGQPGFYAYSYPEPPGFAQARVQPGDAFYSSELREFILPYESVRTASNPDELLLQFLQSTYDAGADLGGWNRAELERLSPDTSPRMLVPRRPLDPRP